MDHIQPTWLEELRGDPLRTKSSHAELKINEQLIETYHKSCGDRELGWNGYLQRTRTHFFHLMASIRRKKNMIKALQNSLGVEITDPSELKVMATTFYESLYAFEGVENMEHVVESVPRKVTADRMHHFVCPTQIKKLKLCYFRYFPLRHWPGWLPCSFLSMSMGYLYMWG